MKHIFPVPIPSSIDSYIKKMNKPNPGVPSGLQAILSQRLKNHPVLSHKKLEHKISVP